MSVYIFLMPNFIIQVSRSVVRSKFRYTWGAQNIIKNYLLNKQKQMTDVAVETYKNQKVKKQKNTQRNTGRTGTSGQ